jgi:hypothetical protein
MHAENGLFLTILGLLFWDVFEAALSRAVPGDLGGVDDASVPTTTADTHQHMPCDLLLASCRVCRKIDPLPCSLASNQAEPSLFLVRHNEAVGKRLLVLEQDCADGSAVSDILKTSWATNHGKVGVGVNWDRNSLEELTIICRSMGGAAVASICSRLLANFSSWSHGAPDLFFWRSACKNKKQHKDCRRSKVPFDFLDTRENALIQAKGLCFVEVKGPRDRLSHQQKAWIDTLLRVGLPAHTCHVEPI